MKKERRAKVCQSRPITSIKILDGMVVYRVEGVDRYFYRPIKRAS